MAPGYVADLEALIEKVRAYMEIAGRVADYPVLPSERLDQSDIEWDRLKRGLALLQEAHRELTTPIPPPATIIYP